MVQRALRNVRIHMSFVVPPFRSDLELDLDAKYLDDELVKQLEFIANGIMRSIGKTAYAASSFPGLVSRMIKKAKSFILDRFARVVSKRRRIV